MHDFPVAIVGVSYRAPGVGGKGLWEFLSGAKSAFSPVPKDRFEQDAFYHPDQSKAGTFSSKGAHFLPDDIYKFDAPFFNLRPDEARAVDPQHRMILECALEAAESAGMSLGDLSGSDVGVFSAIGTTEFAQQEDLFHSGKWSALGGAPCMFANRLSYFFNLHGPSISLDAACASSSYAIHLACQALRSGDCSAAFVSAAALLLGPALWNCLDKLGALSPEGRCFSYDSKASGFGRGEGAASLLIKPLDQAISAGDPIYAVIRNTATSHSGRTEGITMPSRVNQEKLLWRVHQNVGLDPGDTPVVEGHGTGTQAGHLEGASGILGVVKSIMMLRHGQILPSAGFEKFNTDIEGQERLLVPTKVYDWPAGAARRVLVTNFGFGGSNAAVLLEAAPTGESKLADEAQPAPRLTTGLHANEQLSNGFNGHEPGAQNGANGIDGSHSSLPKPRLFVFSAKSKTSLASYLESIKDYVSSQEVSEDFLRRLSYTLQRRTQHSFRSTVIASSREALEDGLLQLPKALKAKDRPVSFVFTGQGAQYPRMAVDLLQYSEPFTEAIRFAEEHLQDMGASWSLTEELNKPDSSSRINDAELSQPLCTAIQLALGAVLRSWGVNPGAVMGHSSGEIAAAHAAGLVSFRAAMAIAYHRGLAASRISKDQSNKGAMLALGADPVKVSKMLEQLDTGYATIAAINSPQSVTVSGDETAIDRIKQFADSESFFSRKLRVNVAYHSKHMNQAAFDYLAAIEPYIEPQTSDGACVFVSSVTGQLEGHKTVNASYWVKNLLQPVKFLNAFEQMMKLQDQVLIEVGPHSALQGPIKQTLDSARLQDQAPCEVRYLPSLVRGSNGLDSIYNLAANLYSLGPPIDLAAVNETDSLTGSILSGLPPYAWDRSHYLSMARVTQETLHPGQPLDQLLGRRSVYNSGDPTFRTVFTLDDLPWIRDHNVGGNVIFPMTAYLSLAIEAVRRVSQGETTSVSVRNFLVKRSLDIEEDQRIDITTQLRPAQTGTESFSSNAWLFEIRSWNEADGWISHCHGQVESLAHDLTESHTFTKARTLIGQNEVEAVGPEVAYGALDEGGTIYGPAFRPMLKLWEGDGWTIMETELRDMDLARGSFGSPIAVDPPTLDSHLQGIGPFQGKNAHMPNYVSRLRLASRKMPSSSKQKFTIVTRLVDHDAKAGTLHSNVAVFAIQDDNLTPVAEWEYITYRSITSSDAWESVSLPSGYAWSLVPSMDFIDDSTLEDLVMVSQNDLEAARQHRQKVNLAGVYYMQRALQNLNGVDVSRLPPHLARFFKWSEQVVKRAAVAVGQDTTPLLEEVSSADAQGEMLCRVGEQLPAILREEVKPLEIMLKDNLLMRNYEAEAGTQHGSRALARFVKQLQDLKPDLQILEVGAGTASSTLPILEELSRDDGELPAYLNYTVTDISTGFFEGAREKLVKWVQRLTFKKLDISQHASLQGFDLGKYDVVIASNVLHATSDIGVTLDHVRALLRPQGKLLLMEAIRHPPLSLPFALLPGWWLSEDAYRDHEEGPLLSEDKWKQVLASRGFSGVDSKVADYPKTEEHVISVMVSTRVGIEADIAETLTICGPIVDDDEEEFAQAISASTSENMGFSPQVKPFFEIEATDDPYCVFVDSPQQSVMRHLDEGGFNMLKSLFLETKGLLWVIPQGCSPEADSVKGLLRTLRHETEEKNILLLENVPRTAEGASAICQVAKRLTDAELAADSGIKDEDFLYENGIIQVPRLRQLAESRDSFASEAGLPVRTMQRLQRGESVEMTVDAAGSPDSVYFRKNDVKTCPLEGNEVLVEVEAAGVNFRDLLLVLGSIPWTRPGFEGAGKIVKVGTNVSNVQVGDRVFFGLLAGGSLANYVRIASWRVCRTPEDMSSQEAASISVAYATAIWSLHIGRLKKGESILIHAASGAVGQACIVLAQHIGAEIYATAGTTSKRQFLGQIFGIDENHIFSSRTADFRDGVLSATDGKGVDMVVNSLSGHLLQETWSLVADFGRFVEIGKRDLLQNSYLGMKPFDRNVSFSAIDLRTLFARRPEDERFCLSELSDLIRRKVIKPIQPVTAMPISQLSTGLRKLQSGHNIGKIVVTIGPEDRVLAEANSPMAVKTLLRSDATYIITGGTGGIGISLATWMVDNGARHVVLFGRSGSSRPQVRSLLDKYEGTDVQMRAVACDVGNKEDLAKALQTLDGPPVRGIIHGALYLRDSMLANATYDDWQKITAPRVQGAWNLHELVGEADFFIALSSFVGSAGNIGQGIYSGTATFFDAFARMRNDMGWMTVAMALPVVLDCGYAADNNLTEALRVSLGATLTEADVRTAVKGAIIGPGSGLNRDGAAINFRWSSDEDATSLGWNFYHPLALAERINAKQRSAEENPAQSGDAADVRAGGSGDLLESLMDKVSAITMIDRDEIQPDAPLANYGLDSLVSVELRNWIRKSQGADIALPKIVGAANLRALAVLILSQRAQKASS